MHDVLGELPPTSPPARGAAEPEVELLLLLLDAADVLAAAGQADKACRLAAGAWVALRAPRPDLAVRVTAALHRLARSASAEPVTFTAGPRPGGAGARPGDADLDVRQLAPAQRHEKIFATYGALGP